MSTRVKVLIEVDAKDVRLLRRAAGDMAIEVWRANDAKNWRLRRIAKEREQHFDSLAQRIENALVAQS